MATVNIIRNPVGTFSFVGQVPIDLAFELGGEVSTENRNKIMSAVSQCGPGIARQIANKLGIKFRERTFDTREEAYNFALTFRSTSGIDFDIN